jgi:uncharacterized membrane protein
MQSVDSWKKKCFTKFLYSEKRKRKLENFETELKTFRDMEEDELFFEYMEVKTEYEHKKNVLTLFVISVAFAILMSSWSKFGSFVQLALKYVAESEETAIVGVCIVILATVLIFITVTILFLLSVLSKDIKELRRKHMIIERVIKEQSTVEEKC